MAVAQAGAAGDVIRVFQEFAQFGRQDVPIVKVTIMNAGNPAVNGDYMVRDAFKLIPEKFALVCDQNGWNTQNMWAKLSGAGSRHGHVQRTVWFESPNKSYIYFNVADGHWWIDGP